MYQANPHSANDKYSALDNVQMGGGASTGMGGGSGMTAFGGNQPANTGGFDAFGNNSSTS